MGAGDTFVAIAFAGVLVGVLIVIGNSFVRFLDYKQKRLELTAGSGESAGRIEQLEHRVRVLERIATDKGVDLADQIESLRTPMLEESAR